MLPTLFALGVFTFVRLAQSSTEDLLYGRAIDRIRADYRQVTGEHARYLLLGGREHVYGVLANMGMRRPPRWQLWFALAAMVAALNTVIAATLALIVGRLADWQVNPADQRHEKPTRPYRSQRRSEAAAATRLAILATALRLFLEHGYSRVTVQDIADQDASRYLPSTPAPAARPLFLARSSATRRGTRSSTKPSPPSTSAKPRRRRSE